MWDTGASISLVTSEVDFIIVPFAVPISDSAAFTVPSKKSSSEVAMEMEALGCEHHFVLSCGSRGFRTGYEPRKLPCRLVQIQGEGATR